MKGYRLHAWGDEPLFEEIEDPVPGPGEVLIEVEACGVGLTVLNAMRGDLDDDPGLLPRVPGHELVGKVVGGSTELMGRRVVGYFYLACGRCRWCLAGWEQRCLNLAGWVGVHRDGGYARYAVLPELNAISVRDDLDPIAATVVADAVATPIHVAGRAGIGPGDRVVVIGAGGGVGIHMVQVAQLRRALVAGLDVTPAKLELVGDYGARPFDSTEIAGLQSDELFDGEAPTVVVDFVGTVDSMRWAIDALGTGGRLIQLTTFRDRVAAITSREMVFREISIIASRYATRAEVREASEMLADERVEAVIGRTVGPAGLGGLHADLKDGRVLGRGAIDWGLL